MDELLKQRVMAGVVGFNITVCIYQIIFYLYFSNNSWGLFLINLFVSVVVGALVGAGAFVAVQMSQK